ncbi:hypothetical protein HanRHA438_Chr14g0673491 [Helianthus annuus]|nr:hypothetical protein HanRHA438_Chr14g0673491 [Helianthus annuus]
MLKTGFVGTKTPITVVNEIRKNLSQITTTAVNRSFIRLGFNVDFFCSSYSRSMGVFFLIPSFFL